MAAFNPANIKPASKSAEFSDAAPKRTAKDTICAALDKQMELFKDAKMEGRRWFTIGKAETALSIRYANSALVLKDGEKTVVFANGELEGALTYFKEQVGKGVFDDQLAALEASGTARKAKASQTRAEKRNAKTGATTEAGKDDEKKPDTKA